jgi:hypothetical protein
MGPIVYCQGCGKPFEDGSGGYCGVCDVCAFTTPTPLNCADCGKPIENGRYPVVHYTSGEDGCSECHPPSKSRAELEDEYDGPDGPEAFE